MDGCIPAWMADQKPKHGWLEWAGEWTALLPRTAGDHHAETARERKRSMSEMSEDSGWEGQ